MLIYLYFAILPRFVVFFYIIFPLSVLTVLSHTGVTPLVQVSPCRVSVAVSCGLVVFMHVGPFHMSEPVGSD